MRCHELCRAIEHCLSSDSASDLVPAPSRVPVAEELDHGREEAVRGGVMERRLRHLTTQMSVCALTNKQPSSGFTDAMPRPFGQGCACVWWWVGERGDDTTVVFRLGGSLVVGLREDHSGNGLQTFETGVETKLF